MSAADNTKPSLEEVLTPCTQIAGTATETLWLVVVGLGLLAGVFYVALDTAISPFAPSRGLETPAAAQKTSIALPRLPQVMARLQEERP